MGSGAQDALWAFGFGAGIGEVIALTIDADHEHGAAVAVAFGLVGGENGTGSALGRAVADTLPETAMTKLVGAAEEFDGEVGGVGGDDGFHGSKVLVAQGENVGPHRRGV